MISHDDVMEKIHEVSDQPAKMIPLVLVGYAAAVIGIAGGFGLICAFFCHR